MAANKCCLASSLLHRLVYGDSDSGMLHKASMSSLIFTWMLPRGTSRPCRPRLSTCGAPTCCATAACMGPS